MDREEFVYLYLNSSEEVKERIIEVLADVQPLLEFQE